tara:strand:- start:3785 stop:4318 length:534 start_codon:yes stop_codon:yes gene_type:complete
MKLKISELKTNTENPRIIKDNKFKQLVKSVKEFPEMLELRPIIIDEDNIILGGNMRFRACVEAGHKEVNVKVATGLTEEQKKEFIVKDNVGFGEWEWDILGNEWETKKLAEWGLDVWNPELEPESEGYQPPENPFEDTDAGYKSQYGVIVTCETEKDQEGVFQRLTAEGFKCKIVVT